MPGVYHGSAGATCRSNTRVLTGNVPQFDPSHYGEWYPLGVYSLMAGPDDMGTRIVQLAVDRHGHIAGNYYDMITDPNTACVRRHQPANAARGLVARTAIRTSASAPASTGCCSPTATSPCSFPAAIQRWQFVRLEN